MRVLRLEFQNLNSLRGRQVLDFQTEAFSGIFAITGPTGAGKSTILDAITLALFGRAARYAAAQPKDMMTRHTAECFAEIHFEGRDGTFGARWELRRARGRADGEFQPAKRFVYALPSREQIHTRTREVDEWIEEQIGLDYTRFLRSVLLAQGEFTAFLKASERERGQLLENLTATGIYGELSRLAHESARDRRQSLDLKRAAFPAEQPMSDEARQQLAKDHAEALAEEKLRGLFARKLREQEACLRQWHQLREQRLACETSRQALAREIDLARASLERWEKHRSTEPLAQPIQTWLELRQARADRESRLAKSANLLGSARNEEIGLAEQVTILDRKQALLSNQLAELRALVNQVLPLDAQIQLRRESLRDLRAATVDLEKEAEKARARGHEEDKQLAATRKALKTREEWIAQNSGDAMLAEELPRIEEILRNLQEAQAQTFGMETRRAEDEKRLTKLEANRQAVALQHQEKVQEMVLLRTKRDALESSAAHCLDGQTRSEWEAKQSRLRREITEQESLLTWMEKHVSLQSRQGRLEQALLQAKNKAENLADELTLLERELSEWNQRREAQAQAREIHLLRANLRPTEPCPVCGALDHPRIQDDALAESPSLDAEQDWRVCSEKREQRKIELARTQERLESAKTEAEAHALTLLAHEEGRRGQAMPHVNETRQKLEHLIAEEQVNGLRLQQCDLLREEWSRAQNLWQTLVETSALLERRLASDEAQAGELKRGLAVQAEAIKESQLRRDRASAQARLTLAPFGEELPQGDDGQECLRRLRERRQAWAAMTEQSHALANKLREQAAALERQRQEAASLVKSLAEKVESIQAVEKELAEASNQRVALFEERVPSIELTKAEEKRTHALSEFENARKLLAQCRAEILAQETLKQSLEAEENTQAARLVVIEHELAEAAACVGWVDWMEFAQAHLPHEEARALEALARALDDKKLGLKAEEARIEEAWTALESRRLGLGMTDFQQSDVEEISAQLTKNEAEQREFQRVAWELDSTLRRDADLRTKQSHLSDELTSMEAALSRWERLASLIGSADGARFSRFAQSLTLGQLLHLANRHLDQLSGRYHLRRRPGSDLEIEVIDLFQANAIRATQSLSGGESFLASLALALALSELASGQTRIDSLFIDEGFGSLDEQTLDVAISALEALQAQRKMVGVISHHELIKERLSTQIQVLKGAGGVSSLRLREPS